MWSCGVRGKTFPLKDYVVMKQFLVVLMVMGFASAALAQGPGGRGTGGIMGLVSMEEVQKELSMTEAQVAKFTALRGDRNSQQNLSREERQTRSEELAKKADEAVKTVLDEKQQHRLSELRIQRDGASSLSRAEVAEKLG
jgi:Spy/CpxP family protein refolding chaperone